MAFRSLLRGLGTGLSIIEAGLAVLAALAAMAILLITSLDVVMRYALNAPLGWAYDLVVHYLLVATFFLGFPLALGRGDHIAIDFLARKIRARPHHLVLFPACLAASVMVAVMACYATHEVYLAWRGNEQIAGVILWPVWLAKLCIPAALWPMAVRLAQMGIAHGAAALDPRRFPFEAPGLDTFSEQVSPQQVSP